MNLVSGEADILINNTPIGDPLEGPNVWELSPQNPVNIPPGYWHKGRNLHDEPAHIVEIWKGDTDKLSEEDIERWYEGGDIL